MKKESREGGRKVGRKESREGGRKERREGGDGWLDHHLKGKIFIMLDDWYRGATRTSGPVSVSSGSLRSSESAKTKTKEKEDQE